MARVLRKKCKEALISVLPVTAIVLLLNLSPLVHLSQSETVVFVISSLLLIVGIGLFNMGADMAMMPMGEQIGSGLTKTRRSWLLLGVCFLMGLMITVAEPDLTVLAAQIRDVVREPLLVAVVGIGVGFFLLLAVVKIITRKSLSSLLLYFYFMLFAMASLVIVHGNTEFLSIAFDSGGVTTGPITVPFIMALGLGIASSLGGKDSGENSFGLVALCSVGPVLAVTVLGITVRDKITYTVPDYSMESQLGAALWRTVGHTAKEVLVALGLIAVFFFLLQVFFLKLPRKKLLQIVVGIGYTFVGLVIFLSAVSIGFMPVGYRIGTDLAAQHPALLVGFAVALGALVVLAEPAVHVLNAQVEQVTDGGVSKRSMMIALSLGVGLSIGLSVVRILFDFSLLYYLIPGYLLSLGLSLLVPGLYTAIAFDSGGVASGPLTSSFILPFAVGVCVALQGEAKVLSDAFGIVAMVAMTPLIMIQLLGFRAVFSRKMRTRIAMRRILAADDEQIIDFT